MYLKIQPKIEAKSEAIAKLVNPDFINHEKLALHLHPGDK